MISGGTSRPRRQMVNLGKVQAPKPVNLPSQRRENHGLDPSISLVPKHAGWGAPSAPGMPGTAPPAPSAWSIPGPGESLSPEPEGAPAPPPKGPPSGPPAAPPRAIPAGTPAYTPQPAWGGAGLPEARQEVSNLVKQDDFVEGQGYPGGMAHGSDGAEGKPHYAPGHGPPSEHGSMELGPRAAWRAPEGFGFGMPQQQQEQGPPPYDEYWRRAPWQGHPGMMPPPPQHRPWPGEHGPDERFGGPGRSSEEMPYGPAPNGPGPYIPPQQRGQGPPRYMEHPPPPPPPRAGLANGHPAELPFYHPHPPSRDGMPYPDPMHYPHHMDQPHGSQRFGHPQENDRFQHTGQWAQSHMPSGPQEGHGGHPRDGYGEPGQAGGYAQHQPQPAEHVAESGFREGQQGDEGHPQRSASDADASGAGNEPRDQKNVHSDWSSLADEPMDFGQAPAFAEDSSNASASAPQNEASRKRLWRLPHQEQAAGPAHPGQQERQQQADYLQGDDGDPHHPTKILQRSRTPTVPQHAQPQQPYMYMQGPPFRQGSFQDHPALHGSHPPPPPPHPHSHLHSHQQQQQQHFHQVQHQQQLLQQQHLPQQLPHQLLQRPPTGQSSLQQAPQTEPSSASAATSVPNLDRTGDEVTSLPHVHQQQRQQEGAIGGEAPQAGVKSDASHAASGHASAAPAGHPNPQQRPGHVHDGPQTGANAAQLQRASAQDAADKQPAPLKGQQKSVELPDDLMVTHELPPGPAPFIPRPAGGLPSWQIQQVVSAQAPRTPHSSAPAVQFGTITPPQTSRHQPRDHASQASRQLHPQVATVQPLLFGAPGGWTTEAGFRPASSQLGSNPNHQGQLLQQLFPGMSGSQGPVPVLPGPGSQLPFAPALPFRPPRPSVGAPQTSQAQPADMRQESKAAGQGQPATASVNGAPLRQGPPADKPAASRMPANRQQPSQPSQQPQAADKGHPQAHQQTRQQSQNAQVSGGPNKPSANGPSAPAPAASQTAAGPNSKASDGWDQPGAIPTAPGKDEWGDLEPSSSQRDTQRGAQGPGRGARGQQQGGRGGAGRGRGRNREGPAQGSARQPGPTPAAQGLVTGGEAKRMAQEAVQQASAASRPRTAPNQTASRGASAQQPQDAFDAAQVGRSSQPGPSTSDRRASGDQSQSSRRRDARGAIREASAPRQPAAAQSPQHSPAATAQPGTPSGPNAAQGSTQAASQASSVQPGGGQAAERQPGQQREGRTREHRPAKAGPSGLSQSSKPDDAQQGPGASGQQQPQTGGSTVSQSRPAAGGEGDLPQRRQSERGGNRRRGRQDRGSNGDADAAAPSVSSTQGPPPGLAPTTGPSTASQLPAAPASAAQAQPLRQAASTRQPAGQPSATPTASRNATQQQQGQVGRLQSSRQRDDRRRGEPSGRHAQEGSANQQPASKMRSDSMPDRQGSGNEQRRQQQRQQQQAGDAPPAARSPQGRGDQRGPTGSRQNERQSQSQSQRQSKSGGQGHPSTSQPPAAGQAAAAEAAASTGPATGQPSRAPTQERRSGSNASGRPPTRSGGGNTPGGGATTPLPGPPAGPGPHRASTGQPVTPDSQQASLAPPPGIAPPPASGAPAGNQPRDGGASGNGVAASQGRSDQEGGRGRQGAGRGGRNNRRGRSRDRPPTDAPEPPPGIAAPGGPQAGTTASAGEAAPAHQQLQSSSGGRGRGRGGRGGTGRNSDRSDHPRRENSQSQFRQQGEEGSSGQASAPRAAEGNENRPPRGRGRGDRQAGEGNRRGPEDGPAPGSAKPGAEARSSGPSNRSGEGKPRSTIPGNQQAKAPKTGSMPDRPSGSGHSTPARPAESNTPAPGASNPSVAG